MGQWKREIKVAGWWWSRQVRYNCWRRRFGCTYIGGHCRTSRWRGLPGRWSETQAGARPVLGSSTRGRPAPRGGHGLAGEEGRLRRNVHGGDRGADKGVLGLKERHQAAKGIRVTVVFSG